MPNRIVSDITWKSRKIRQLRKEFRAEYTWLLPLFNECGVAELDPESIWHSAYALNRPDWSPEQVQELCEALVAVGLWAAWKQDGHEYVYLVGSHKPGLLPKPSDRNPKALRPPADLLARFVGGDATPQPPASSPDPTPERRLGNGDGAGNGNGMGIGSGSGSGHGAGAPQVTSPDQTADTQAMPRPEQKQFHAKAAGQDSNVSSINSNPKPVKRPYPGDRAGLVSFFYRLVKNNPRATGTPANWEQNWTPDIEEMLRQYTFDDVVRIMETSQTSKFAQYVYRGKTLLKYAAEIATLLKIEPKKTEVGIDDI